MFHMNRRQPVVVVLCVLFLFAQQLRPACAEGQWQTILEQCTAGKTCKVHLDSPSSYCNEALCGCLSLEPQCDIASARNTTCGLQEERCYQRRVQCEYHRQTAAYEHGCKKEEVGEVLACLSANRGAFFEQCVSATRTTGTVLGLGQLAKVDGSCTVEAACADEKSATFTCPPFVTEWEVRNDHTPYANDSSLSVKPAVVFKVLVAYDTPEKELVFTVNSSTAEQQAVWDDAVAGRHGKFFRVRENQAEGAVVVQLSPVPKYKLHEKETITIRFAPGVLRTRTTSVGCTIDIVPHKDDDGQRSLSTALLAFSAFFLFLFVVSFTLVIRRSIRSWRQEREDIYGDSDEGS